MRMAMRMREEEITGGPPNLDCLTTPELYEFAARTRGVSPRKVAREMFPGRRKSTTRAVRWLHQYTWNLITARACRERGEIETAMQYEGICQRIYENLPEWARW